ncbi:MAG: hypothetical protein J6S85_10230 [Methanobrevibacter sp.]|nr:hypothetical protein [Methanobrevibacter sp.]
MKYIAVLDEEMLSYFRTYDCGRTLVLKDERGYKRAINLKPIVRPLFVNTDGKTAYLTQGHIDCMLDYERNDAIKRVVESFDFDFNPWKRLTEREKDDEK